MKKRKTLHNLIMMAKYVSIGVIMQAFLCSMLIAAESSAQKSIEDIYLSLAVENASITKVFKKIEQETGFDFSYKKDIESSVSPITLTLNQASLGDVLRTLSKEAQLSFKRVNDAILVKKQALPATSDTSSTAMVEEALQVKISGKVTASEDNEPLPGVSILVKGTASGTTTDIDGNYNLSVSEGSILQFSYIGFITQEITVGDQTILNISLESDLEQLEEVVVVGYGTQKKSDLTSAIAQVKGEDIAMRVSPRLDEALQGQMAGVSVQQASGVPGAAPNIRIRGVGSINAGSNPLFVIDGFPVEDPTVVANLNMNDVQSVEVLKDAASAAIYGSRGSNGVVIITTKSGQSDKLSIKINSFYGVQEGERFWEYLDGNTAGQLYAAQRNRLWVEEGGRITDPNESRPPNRRIDPNWILGNQPTHGGNDFIFRTAPIQNHSVSLSGGSEKTTFFSSMDYLRQDGIARGSNFERYSARIKVQSDLSAKLRIGFNLSPSYSRQLDADTEGKDNAIDRLLTLGPLTPLDGIRLIPNEDPSRPPVTRSDYDIEYDVGLSFHGARVLNFLNARQLRKRPQILANTFLNYEITDGLVFRSSLGVSYNGFHMTNDIPAFANNGVASIERESGNSTNWLLENTLNYTKQIGKHSFSALIGYTSQRDFNQRSGVRAQGFPNDLALTLGNASNIQDWYESVNEWSLISGLSRLTYDYSDKYFITASVRRDGSSRFGTNTRWGTFSSISGAWRLSEESFLSQSELISNLKLRASWGQTGNNQIGNYSWIPSLESASAPFGDNEGLQPGLSPSQFGNDELSWEKTSATNIGVDLGAINDRITLGVEYYHNLTTDMLFAVPIPSVTGFRTAIQNIGKVVNTGFEIELNTFNTVGEFEWNTKANFSHNENEVLATGWGNAPLITGEWFAQSSYTGVGRPIGTFYLLEQIGIFQNQEEVDSSPTFGSEGPGDVKIRDVNGDGVINNDDRTFFGQPTPIWNFGITNQFKYRNFDLSIFINGAGGHQTFFIGGRIHDRSFANGNGKNMTSNWANSWRSEEEPGDGRTPNFDSAVPINTTVPTTRWLYDSDWVRIKNLTFGYTLPKQILENRKLESVRVYTTIDNMFLWTKYPGANPEGVGLRGGSVSQSAGYDYGTYPLTRRVVFGLNITL